MRQICLDTETTGLSHATGHRIIEIGCVELVNRKLTNNNFHVYLNPNRAVDYGAQRVHGLTNDFLKDKPLFEEIAKDLVEYLDGAEIIIHNASFDVGFLNAEFQKLNFGWDDLHDHCTVTDTLAMARKKYPGQKKYT
jgi:DNA polymerase-3 subunit epsilon